jgi:ABC-type uncharacterized transport system fused permease/ATPase subunit
LLSSNKEECGYYLRRISITDIIERVNEEDKWQENLSLGI